MKEKDIAVRREELEKLSTLDLDRILRAELDGDTPNRENILLILSILEDRDPTDPQNRPEGAAEAWNAFVNRTGYPRPIEKPIRKTRKWYVPVAAAAAVVLILLMAVPQTVGAENIFEILGRWTRDIFCLFDIEGTSSNDEYIFETDHEGLQQVYDAVVALGVTDPIVPTWIPNGYILKEMRLVSPNEHTKVYAKFENQDYYIQFVVEIYSVERSNKYTKDDIGALTFDFSGVYYSVVPNGDTWKATWNYGVAECSLVTNDTQQVLCQILNSIKGRATE